MGKYLALGHLAKFLPESLYQKVNKVIMQYYFLIEFEHSLFPIRNSL